MEWASYRKLNVILLYWCAQFCEVDDIKLTLCGYQRLGMEDDLWGSGEVTNRYKDASKHEE